MDAAVDGIPPIMWEPDRSMSTKMDELRVRINEKYNEDLRKFSLFRISSAWKIPVFDSTCAAWTYQHVRLLWTQELLLLYCRNRHSGSMYLDIYSHIFDSDNIEIEQIASTTNIICSSNFHYCLLTAILCPNIFMQHIF